MWHANRESVMFSILFVFLAVVACFGLFCAIAGAPERAKDAPPGPWERLLRWLDAREAAKRRAKIDHDEHEQSSVG